jgi:aldehyde:ferredoxin oxidoreductase
MALGFAVGTRGADHNRSGAYEVDFSEAIDRRNPGAECIPLAIDTENKAALMDSLILCKFLRGVFSDFYAEAAEMLQLVTGWDTSADELRQTAAQIVTAKKRFNILAGWTPAEDTLPDRILHQQLPEDSRAQLSPDRLRGLVQAYNRERGWTTEGWLPEGP